MGLARKLNEEPISAGEAAALAQLPLPPVLEHLEHTFAALNAVYTFLLNKHVQVMVLGHCRLSSQGCICRPCLQGWHAHCLICLV